ncbi:helix-turn-helix domain-containing protein [Veillonella sp. CHU732]|uniref:helix-turn-helix domain-containing protein n=1 Tax=Veillonella sp. CHU732 TaxID=2490949 RepID=UPI000F8DD5B9|nr:helix-turn-helix transcriptional regulator [Veillonella sp. CHU732]
MDIKKDIIFRQIGAKVAYYRSLRNLTQIQLANLVNISESTLSRLERGKYNSNISVSILLDISKALKIEVAELLTFSDQEKKLWYE